MKNINRALLQSELQEMQVYGETQVGWDENIPPNETVDSDGNPENRRFGAADPNSPKRRVYDDPEVEALRETLRKHNGIRGLEICEPSEVKKIARIFRRDGFVVVRDLLNAEQLARLRKGCAEALREILSIPGQGNRKYANETGRLPHRYSYGTSSASRHMLHHPAWASMIDLPTTTPIVTEIFGSSDYRVWGSGGDLCLPGAIEYQHLHSDVRDPQHLTEGRIKQAKLLGVELHKDESGNLSVATQKLIMELTSPLVTINFVMCDLTWENGPIRQIPGTHALQQSPPSPADEPDWMRHSTLVGATAGSGVFRDNRAWHGATPNLSKEIRALPNVEYSPMWRPQADYTKSMPHEIWETLTPHAQKMCEWIKADPGVLPAGAGFMHPLASKRTEAVEKQNS
ncbi:MAG: phytanoyl-CoA dioxygenase family protein [Candidatus Poribacteria bacterium]|nr:phytanoyl-CoA dioxygenase family protein [Candidatus Poribacteria bacterium]